MEIDRLTSVVARTFFLGAFLLLAVAVLEKVLNAFGASALGVTAAGPARLLEWAVILLIFVIALLLRQIREALKTGSA
jgi:hypothetical protein